MAIICVSGDPGSGKTTLCTRLADALDYSHSYTGGILRKMAEEHDQSIDAFYAALKDDPELEKEIDRRQERLMQTGDNLVVEGRMAPFLHTPLPRLNVKIAVETHEGARRMSTRPDYTEKTLEQIEAITTARVQAEREHYYDLYGISDHLADETFDIIVDTTDMNEEKAFAELLKRVRNALSEECPHS